MAYTKNPSEATKGTNGELSVGSHVTDTASFEFDDTETRFHASDFGVMESYGTEVKVVSFFFNVTDKSSDDGPSEYRIITL